ncbi:hypothetical protein [Sulfuriroseicoccus oceanibius]|uniref:Uncharacterized protein n=1 Tax=Sulfuriroseicoccus oceanibius TaxID=2707525 RepID=A0A6B3L4Z6_9BACT|nr:hypothetical protein [Sulfuriroseicoccus oceanibius]QQL44714.1 hypothetical protein G3M56_012650 [Sulfuriroseicoccus oceanibius]
MTKDTNIFNDGAMDANAHEEARIVAMLLGEASDFEKAELEGLIATRPDLQAFCDEMAALLPDVRAAHGHSGPTADLSVNDDELWELSKERRASVRAALAEVEDEGRADETSPVVVRSKHWPGRRQMRRNLQVAAAVALFGGVAAVSLGVWVNGRRPVDVAGVSPELVREDSAPKELTVKVASRKPEAVAVAKMENGANDRLPAPWGGVAVVASRNGVDAAADGGVGEAAEIELAMLDDNARSTGREFEDVVALRDAERSMAWQRSRSNDRRANAPAKAGALGDEIQSGNIGRQLDPERKPMLLAEGLETPSALPIVGLSVGEDKSAPALPAPSVASEPTGPAPQGAPAKMKDGALLGGRALEVAAEPEIDQWEEQTFDESIEVADVESEPEVQEMEVFSRKTDRLLGDRLASDAPVSRFGFDGSDASFWSVAASLAGGKWPAPEMVHPEQFIRALTHADPAPPLDRNVRCVVDQVSHPVMVDRVLIRIDVRALGYTAPRDGEVQVTWNPERVERYRLTASKRAQRAVDSEGAVSASGKDKPMAAIGLYHVKLRDEGEGNLGEVSVRLIDPRTGEIEQKRWQIDYESGPQPLADADVFMQMVSVAGIFAEALQKDSAEAVEDLRAIQPVVADLVVERPGDQRVAALRAAVDNACRVVELLISTTDPSE